MMKWFKDRPAVRPRAKRFYRVGDVAPQSLLDHKAGDGNLGAMIAIDPVTKVITAIFHP